VGEVKYINKQMAIDAINGDLPVWYWDAGGYWTRGNFAMLVNSIYSNCHFAIGEKPTHPPRKMIEVDGVRMPAPILNIEDAPDVAFVVWPSGQIITTSRQPAWAEQIKNGNVYATVADAIAARDGWLQVKKQAMERAK
jgi:hypothetical protein